MTRHLAALAVIATMTSPAVAQGWDDPDKPNGGRLVIDLLEEVPPPPRDELGEQMCEEQADAARIAGEIVVCRSLGEVTDGFWNQEDFERRYAERTMGVRTPDLYVDPTPPMVGVTFKAKFGGPGPAPLMIDIQALPEAPPDSDADRIGRGLAPLADYAEPTASEIAERRIALGLPAPPIPGMP